MKKEDRISDDDLELCINALGVVVSDYSTFKNKCEPEQFLINKLHKELARRQKIKPRKGKKKGE